MQDLKEKIKIGTSGYSYEDWRGLFYPQDLPKSKMLEYYCRFFKTVEVNSSYYAIPNINSVRRMVEKTPASFDFIFKTHQQSTHQRQDGGQAVKNLLINLAPAVEAGKLSGLLAQFPFSFRNTENNRGYLVHMRELAKEIPLFVEFRHDSWNKPQLGDFLKSNNIAYVNVDEPQLKGLLPPQALVTAASAYIRFHGRNSARWWQGQGSERYDYLYSENELRQWTENIRTILRRSTKTYIFFNNHPRGQAVKNARQMAELIARHILIASNES